jgi:hypothetical protein
MTIVIIVEKENIKENKINDINELYKKCKFKKVDDFVEINTWNYNNSIIKLYGKLNGKNQSKNLYKFPDLDKTIYGSCALVCLENNNYVDLKIEDWNNFVLNKNNKESKENKETKENFKNKEKDLKIDNKNLKQDIDSDNEKDEIEKEDDDEDIEDENMSVDSNNSDNTNLDNEYDKDDKDDKEDKDDKDTSDINEEIKYFSGSELSEDLYIYTSDEDN